VKVGDLVKLKSKLKKKVMQMYETSDHPYSISLIVAPGRDRVLIESLKTGSRAWVRKQSIEVVSESR